MEDLDDIFLEPTGAPPRPGGRFRPKAKPPSRKVASIAATSALPGVITEKSVSVSTTFSDTVAAIKLVDVRGGKITDPVVSSLSTSEILESIEPSQNNENLCTNVPFSDGDKSSKPSESTATETLQPKVAASDGTGDWHSISGKSAGENADIFSGLECLDGFVTQTTDDTGEMRKFKPKLRVKKGKENMHSPRSEVESTMLSQAAHLVPSETGDVNETSCAALLPGDVLDQPSPRFGESSTPNPTFDSQVNTENLSETIHVDDSVFGDVVHSEDVGGVSGKMGRKSRNGKTLAASNHPQKRKSSAASEEAEGETSSMQLRKRLPHQQVDELQEASEGIFTAEPSCDFNINEDENNDDDKEHTTSQRKRAQRKSKRLVSDKEEPVRKRKRANKAPEQSTKDPPKKFSHSTRRNRRLVDKTLLETPEDEIDPQKLPIKDLIRLAEHKEQLEIKEARKLSTPLPDQSANNDSHKEASQYEEETVASEHDRSSDENQASYKVNTSSSSLNYQSYMNKAPTARWSKQDTELFYEAIHHLGSDFEMMKTLYFPGRTRHQVKLKYKKEERQHPSRISEALHSHSNGHAQTTSFIERLQQFKPPNKESNASESLDLTGKEELNLTDDIDEGVTKPELDQVEDQEATAAEVEGQEADAAQVTNPSKSDEIEDDFFTWGEDDD